MERQVDSMKPAIKQDVESWQAGYQHGMNATPAHSNPRLLGLDGLSYSSGYIEGKAKRQERILCQRDFDASARTE